MSLCDDLYESKPVWCHPVYKSAHVGQDVILIGGRFAASHPLAEYAQPHWFVIRQLKKKSWLLEDEAGNSLRIKETHGADFYPVRDWFIFQRGYYANRGENLAAWGIGASPLSASPVSDMQNLVLTSAAGLDDQFVKYTLPHWFVVQATHGQVWTLADEADQLVGLSVQAARRCRHLHDAKIWFVASRNTYEAQRRGAKQLLNAIFQQVNPSPTP